MPKELSPKFCNKCTVFQDDSQREMICEIHERECLFYEEFGKMGNLPIPKTFATEKVIPTSRDGAILMEFLKYDGEILHRLEPFSKAQVSKADTAAAKHMESFGLYFHLFTLLFSGCFLKNASLIFFT